MDTNTVNLFRQILDALTPLLTDDPPDVVDRAAQAVLMETGRPVVGYNPGRIVAPKGCNLRAFNRDVIGTIKTGVGLEVGQPEGDWTPVRLTAWVGEAMVKLE